MSISGEGSTHQTPKQHMLGTAECPSLPALPAAVRAGPPASLQARSWPTRDTDIKTVTDMVDIKAACRYRDKFGSPLEGAAPLTGLRGCNAAGLELILIRTINIDADVGMGIGGHRWLLCKCMRRYQ